MVLIFCCRFYKIRINFPAFNKARIMSIVTASSTEDLLGEKVEQATATKKSKIFDFKMWNKRHVAFKVLYLGWDYSGLALQDTTTETIEAKLFDALLKTKLIEDPSQSNYSRCGRTDKGVSAFGQVITLDVRTALLEGEGVIVPEGSKAIERKGDKIIELPYLNMLNRVLPKDIKLSAWAPVPPQFSARFNTMHRIYKYYFPMGSMDIELMREGARKFIGHHDFRNFCKYDTNDLATQSIKFDRTILDIKIEPLDQNSVVSSHQLYACTVTGLAFLRHQIRCMMSLLFLVGHKLEQPSIIDYMLDISQCPGKPQYGMAADFPLVLHDCVFQDIEWQYLDYSYVNVISELQKAWTYHMTQAMIVKSMIDQLEGIDTSSFSPSLLPLPTNYLFPVLKTDHKLGKSYKPIRNRPTSGSYEERCENYKAAKKRKLEDGSSSENT
ncbi:PREDICTED: tRNA pseudouridine(38/39) synthase-like isoform X2 [Amphimedon queenslandica]|uniref:Pseudouridine synthase I TruA alpha/beta domain-containing protein n=1 Tax=Amphimedon queenslandica TaxID=400682 RepID=A0A1X7UHK2_AMPQE|nr:PREDICTED: tRNA pseudouridine(38/39) synthase-like isoform X2 [Amphimedon queenslandica]|eukprot:XP_019854104.1 PREDICTED: tRNA pseudouridine(38/39) synthase-like isoform X2 [Amphimedon queenslandica]